MTGAPEREPPSATARVSRRQLGALSLGGLAALAVPSAGSLAVEPPAPAAEAILVRKDSPITGLAGLSGKRIVVNRGANAHYLLVRALESVGVPYGDVTVTYLPPADGRAAFEASKVDAWSIWERAVLSVL